MGRQEKARLEQEAGAELTIGAIDQSHCAPRAQPFTQIRDGLCFVSTDDSERFDSSDYRPSHKAITRDIVGTSIIALAPEPS